MQIQKNAFSRLPYVIRSNLGLQSPTIHQINGNFIRILLKFSDLSQLVWLRRYMGFSVTGFFRHPLCDQTVLQFKMTETHPGLSQGAICHIWQTIEGVLNLCISRSVSGPLPRRPIQNHRAFTSSESSPVMTKEEKRNIVRNFVKEVQGLSSN